MDGENDNPPADAMGGEMEAAMEAEMDAAMAMEGDEAAMEGMDGAGEGAGAGAAEGDEEEGDMEEEAIDYSSDARKLSQPPTIS